MNVTYRNTPEDLLAYCRHVVRTSEAARGARTLAVALGQAAALALAALVGLLAAESTAGRILAAVLFYLAATWLYQRFGLGAVLDLDARRRLRALLAGERPEAVPGPKTVTFSAARLEWECGARRGGVPWDAAGPIERDEGYVYVHGGEALLVIPERAFGSAEALAEFLNLAFERMAAGTAPREPAPPKFPAALVVARPAVTPAAPRPPAPPVVARPVAAPAPPRPPAALAVPRPVVTPAAPRPVALPVVARPAAVPAPPKPAAAPAAPAILAPPPEPPAPRAPAVSVSDDEETGAAEAVEEEIEAPEEPEETEGPEEEEEEVGAPEGPEEKEEVEISEEPPEAPEPPRREALAREAPAPPPRRPPAPPMAAPRPPEGKGITGPALARPRPPVPGPAAGAAPAEAGGFAVVVKKPLEFMQAMVEALCGEAKLSLEGDLSKANPAGIEGVSPEETPILRRRGTDPAAAFLVFPLEPRTKPLVLARVLFQVGIRSRVTGAQIEKAGRLELAACERFGDVTAGAAVGEAKLRALVEEGIVESYRPR